jgi:hypothetical protein
MLLQSADSSRQEVSLASPSPASEGLVVSQSQCVREKRVGCACRAARKTQVEAQKALKGTAQSHSIMQAAAHQAALNAGVSVDTEGLRLSGRRRSMQDASSIASTLQFMPVSVVWQNLSYYVTVAKGLVGGAALGIMPADADKAIAGKKRLLNRLSGAPPDKDQMFSPTVCCTNHRFSQVSAQVFSMQVYFPTVLHTH